MLSGSIKICLQKLWMCEKPGLLSPNFTGVRLDFGTTSISGSLEIIASLGTTG